MLLQDVGSREVVIRHGNHWKRRKHWLNISSTGSIVKGREDQHASGKRWGAERRTGRLEMFEILWTGVYMYTIITCGFYSDACSHFVRMVTNHCSSVCEWSMKWRRQIERLQKYSPSDCLCTSFCIYLLVFFWHTNKNLSKYLCGFNF